MPHGFGIHLEHQRVDAAARERFVERATHRTVTADDGVVADFFDRTRERGLIHAAAANAHQALGLQPFCGAWHATHERRHQCHCDCRANKQHLFGGGFERTKGTGFADQHEREFTRAREGRRREQRWPAGKFQHFEHEENHRALERENDRAARKH